ncbi:MAG: Lipopolysaccharide assembly protein B [Chlamydiae bacterium]|nr:Lipopolysaccharide assembly protein B [Chlamydiota bacterium]
MQCFKVLALTFALLVVAVTVRYYFSADVAQELSIAQKHFLQDEYIEAEAILKKLEKKISFVEFQLFEAYISRGKGQIDKSDLHLNNALNRPSDIKKLNIEMELYLNQMFNAYLRGDTQALLSSLDKAHQLTEAKTGWTSLFSGAEAYLNKDYARAIREVRYSAERGYLSPWMKKAFQKTFPPSWPSLLLARCEIELGNLSKARQSLETAAVKASSDELQQIYFLLGITYVKEAENKSYQDAIPYYKLAVSNFHRVPVIDGEHREGMEQFLVKIRNDINETIEDQSYENLPFYVEVVEKWGSRDEVEKLRARVTKIDDIEIVTQKWRSEDGEAFEDSATEVELAVIDPKNQQSNLTLGMTAYREADYSKAYSYLKDIESTDLDVLEAQAVASIITGKVTKGNQLLEKVSQSRTIGEETYLRLGFGLLAKDKPIAALQWFEEVAEESNQVLVGRGTIAFELHSWSESLDVYEDLSAPYKDLDGLHGIAIESMTALGQEAQAEDLLKKLLLSSPQPADEEFPIYFQAFKKKKLDYWNRNFVAAQFYRIVKGDNKRALEYFNRIENPTPYMNIEKAETFMAVGRNYEGKKILFRILENIQGSEQESTIKIRLLPMLGVVNAKLGLFADAWPHYKEFFVLKPEDNTHRSEYAKILIELQRYDLALEQYRKLQRSGDLSPSDMISYIESFIRTDQFDAANKISWQWMSSNAVPLYYQIQLAQLMVITKNERLLENIFDTISKRERRSIEENQQLIRLWTDFGNYDDATALAGVLEKDLYDSPEGLMTLVDLYVQLSRFDKALELAQRASVLAPTDFSIADFLERYERRPEIIAKSVKLLKEKIEEDPNSFPLQLNYATDLIDLAVESYVSGEVTEIKDSLDLHTAQAILEKITQKNKDLPEAYYLLGKVYYLLDKEQAAKEAYQTALRLDISYVGAYQHLAAVFEGDKDFNQAISLLRKATKFVPNDSELWEQLGNTLFQTGNTNEAIVALRKAIKYTPNNPLPFIKLAEVYLEINSPEAAVANLEQALVLSPKEVEAVKLMLVALYDPNYPVDELERDLEKRRFRYFDKLQALDPEEAEAMRAQLDVEEE